MDYVPYRHTVRERAWIVAQTTALACTFAFLCLMAWWLFSPYRGLTTYTVALPTTRVVAGGLLRGEIHYCVDAGLPLPMRLDREIVLQNHAVAFPVPDIQYAITQRCESKSRILGIPDYAPPGIYYLSITTTVTVNPLRTIRQTWQSPSFEVVAK